MGELQEAAKWERVGAVETRQEKMEKLLWSGARGVGMVKPVETAGPGVEPGRHGGRGRDAGPPPGWAGT